MRRPPAAVRSVPSVSTLATFAAYALIALTAWLVHGSRVSAQSARTDAPTISDTMAPAPPARERGARGR